MCYRIEHVTYLEGENGIIARETKGVRHVVQGGYLEKSESGENCSGQKQYRTVQNCCKLQGRLTNSYNTDKFCCKLCANLESMAGACKDCKLLYLNDQLVILCTRNICKSLYYLVHNELGHFGTDKTYLTLYNLYYWPNMYCNLECNYILRCNTC